MVHLSLFSSLLHFYRKQNEWSFFGFSVSIWQIENRKCVTSTQRCRLQVVSLLDLLTSRLKTSKSHLCAVPKRSSNLLLANLNKKTLFTKNQFFIFHYSPHCDVFTRNKMNDLYLGSQFPFGRLRIRNV